MEGIIVLGKDMVIYDLIAKEIDERIEEQGHREPLTVVRYGHVNSQVEPIVLLLAKMGRSLDIDFKVEKQPNVPVSELLKSKL